MNAKHFFGLVAWIMVATMATAQDLDAFLTDLARSNNAYQAAKFRWLAAQKEAEASGYLMDPELNLGIKATDLAENGPQLQQLIIMQEIPLAGKLRLERRQAFAMAEVARRDMETVAIEMVTRFKTQYANYYVAGRAASTTSEHLDLLRDLEQVVTTAYKNGKAHYADLIDIQIEIDTIANQLLTQQNTLGPLAAGINILLGQPATANLPVPETLPDVVRAEVLDNDALDRRLIDHNPIIAGFTEQKNADRFALERIAKQGIPNLRVGVEWMNPLRVSSVAPDGDNLMLMVGANIPIYRRKYQAQSVAASARLEAVGQASEHQIAELRAAYRQALFERDDAVRKHVLFRDQILPKAEESLKVTSSAFQNGERTYLDLIEAERALLAFRLSLHEALANGFKAQTMIDAILGTNPLSQIKE